MGVDVKQFGTTTLSALQVSPLLFWHSYAIEVIGQRRYSLTDFEGTIILTLPPCFDCRPR
jgi:hypothetical protein